MAFKFSDAFYSQYETEGYVIFKGIVPGSLVNDLRTALAPVEEYITVTPPINKRGNKKKEKPNPRRYGALRAYIHLIPDLAPLKEYYALSDLMEAIKKITAQDCNYGSLNTLDILRSINTNVFSTPWHRDFLRTPGVDGSPTFQEIIDLTEKEPGFYHQYNFALYREQSLWYVPGSYGRPNTKDEESFEWHAQRARRAEQSNLLPTPVDLEKAYLAEARSMPGAIEMNLEAGDFALYRNNGWHKGNTLPYQKRLTFHDEVHNPAFDQYMDRLFRKGNNGEPRHPVEWDITSPWEPLQTAT